ncbi:hypothetical protein MWH03_00425 [Klebsiella pneumoniae]|nr:hypothetical protein [Klebsiella pneumoniae]
MKRLLLSLLVAVAMFSTVVDASMDSPGPHEKKERSRELPPLPPRPVETDNPQKPANEKTKLASETPGAIPAFERNSYASTTFA